MSPIPWISQALEREAEGLLARLARVKPFVMVEPMVPAAGVDPAARRAIDDFLSSGRRELRGRLDGYLRWLRGPAGAAATGEDAQRRLTMLRLRFNVVLSQFETFADALNQRSQVEMGPWLAGVDVAAAEALTPAGTEVEAPPVVCYVDRSFGAAIRRARTRLPGGALTPVAIIRMPHERMVSTGIASSLVHEVGHQGAAMLDLLPGLQARLRAHVAAAPNPDDREVWTAWESWISEIVADFWAVATVGISATSGMMAVVSLPRPLVFRFSPADPHPVPWVRVFLSAGMGRALYPDARWDRMEQLWESIYPMSPALTPSAVRQLERLRASIPDFVRVLLEYRPRMLRGRTLPQAFGVAERQPAKLAAAWREWKGDFEKIRDAEPTFALAVVGQASFDGLIGAYDETELVSHLLNYWGMRRALELPKAPPAPAAIPMKGVPFRALAAR
jgi:hypothetical protein